MADNTNSGSGAGGGLYFIVGILVAAVVIIGFVAFGGHFPGGHSKVDVTVSAPASPAPAPAK